MVEYFIYIFIALIIAVILTAGRSYVPKDAVAERSLIGMAVGWSLIVYSIILGFSISNFYNRYIDIRENFIKEATNLEIIYMSIKQLPGNDDLIEAIKNYSKNIYESTNNFFAKKQYDPNTEVIYDNLDSLIIKFAKDNPDTSFSRDFLNRLNTDIRIKKLIDEMTTGQYYINILCFLLVFIILPLWLFKLDNIIIQFIIDSCVLIILLSAIYLINILNVPFGYNNPIGLNLSMYNDLYNEILTYQNTI